MEEIIVVHNEQSALEDTMELCHWSSCTPVTESCGQYDPSQEASGGLFVFLKTGLTCSLSFASVTVFAAVFCTS